jgi:hypothetical protein
MTMAERSGVSPEAIRAVLAADEKAMSPDVALGFWFALSPAISNRIASAQKFSSGGIRVVSSGSPSLSLRRAYFPP